MLRTPLASCLLAVAVACAGASTSACDGDDASPNAPPAPSRTGSSGSTGNRDGGSAPRPPPPGVGLGGSKRDGGSSTGLDAGPDGVLDGAVDGGVDGGLSVTLPPLDAPFDYQLGGAYEPPEGVQIVVRDRTQPPVPELYNICYVNGFQIQPGEEAFWLEEHGELVLRDLDGALVVDLEWDEMLIDISTLEKRTAVALVVGGFIRGCADDGFDAVEIDNLDSFTRSAGLLETEDAVAMMAHYSAAAHARGLAIAQKNAAELVPRRMDLGTDFAVAEECNRFVECPVYVDGYDGNVLVIEYRRVDFEDGCAAFPELSIVLRDLELVTPDDAAYVYDGC